jgi:hypothetical protein
MGFPTQNKQKPAALLLPMPGRAKTVVKSIGYI